MKRKEIFKYAVLGFTLLLFVLSDICSANEYEVLKSGFSIGTTKRHEWHPWADYNSVDDEFLVIWRTSGALRDDCAPGDTYACDNGFHGIMGQRITPKGVLLGDTITISPEEGPNDNVSWKSMPRHAYNPFMNEYMITYTVALNPNDPAHDNVIYKARIESNGTLADVPAMLYPTVYNASHPDVAFNSVRREWLVVYNDKYLFRPDDDFDNPGFILDEDGNAISGPFIIGLPIGSNFAPYVDYNPTDDTYLLAWEDWRYGPPGDPWYFRPAEIYGALVDNDGAMLDPEIPVIDDFGLPDAGTQLMPCITYNPDRNEFLVVWGDTSPSFDGGGVLGRIIMSDGTPKGPDFIIANTIGPQGAPKSAYVTKNQSYFVVWQDSRDFTFDPEDPWASENDIYAKWINADGLPIGEDTPIYIGEGNQGMPSVAYSPAADRFFIAWRDEHAPGDYEPVGPGAMMSPEIKADVRGAIYGVPPPAMLNIGDQWANCGDVGVKIPICLINLEVEVGAVQVDLCENIDDCLICVGCEMTERTTIFDCMVNELENGCCAVVVFSKNPGGVINPGECDIVIIDYTIKDEPQCCNSCITIDGENLEVVDQYGYIVDSMIADTGMVCPFECGDVEPAASTAISWDCGDGDVDIFDILEEVDFIIHVKTPDACQAVRADVPTGTPPNCDPPDGTIDVGDLMVIIDMALNRQDCCSYYYGGVIY